MLFSLPVQAAARKGQPAPAFKVTTLSGQQVTLDNYRGRVVLIDFFASWCPPCKESIPHLMTLLRKHAKKDVHVLGIGMDDGEPPLRDFTKKNRLSYPVALGTDDLAAAFEVRSIPTLFVINKKGVVVDRFQGFSPETAAAAEAAIRKALAE